MTDGRKEVEKVNRVVYGVLQDQENYLNQHYRIKTT